MRKLYGDLFLIRRLGLLFLASALSIFIIGAVINHVFAAEVNKSYISSFGIKSTDDNRQYQTAYSKMFLKNNVNDYSKLDKSVRETQEAGSMKNIEFDCTELHEYVVESSSFPQQGTGELPFPPQGSTPWGGKSN